MSVSVIIGHDVFILQLRGSAWQGFHGTANIAVWPVLDSVKISSQ